jgi:hypothetical protein
MNSVWPRKKQQVATFHFLTFTRNKLRDPYIMNNFFNQIFAQCVFEKTQHLPRSQTGLKCQLYTVLL